MTGRLHKAGREAAASVGAGCARQRDARSRGAVQRAERHAAAAGRPRGAATRDIALALAGRGADRRAWPASAAPIRAKAGARRCSCRCSIPRRSADVDAYTRQMDWLVDACHDATPRPGVERVRVPGENGMRRHREQMSQRRGAVPDHHAVACNPGRRNSASRFRLQAAVSAAPQGCLSSLRSRG